MRVNVNPVLSLTTVEGRPFPSAGWLNVFHNASGAVITGKKSYASQAEAKSKNRTPSGWNLLGQVKLEEYIPEMFQTSIKEVLKKRVIELLDDRLLDLLNLKPVAEDHVPTDVVVKPKRKRALIKKKKPTPKLKAKVVAKKAKSKKK